MRLLSIVSLLLLTTASGAFASEFCDGFEIGYKTVKGNHVMVPMCPWEPMTPMGSTPYQEGLKAGMKAARTGS